MSWAAPPTRRRPGRWPGGGPLPKVWGGPPRQSLSSAHLEVEQFLARLKADADAATRMRADLETRLSALEKREREWNETQHKKELERAAAWQRELDALLRNLEERAEQKLRELSSQAPRAMRPQEVSKKAAQGTSKLRQQAQEDLRQTLGAP